MKILERAQIQLRARWRAVRAVRGRGGAWPARLLIRLDDLDAPEAGTGRAVEAAAEAAQRPLPQGTFQTAPGKWRIHRREEGWQDLMLRVYAGAGVVPTRFVGRPDAPFLVSLIRFAHRLEAPTGLRTCGRGLTARIAEAWSDAGLGEVWVRLAGLSPALHRGVCGEEVAEAQAAILALIAARGRGGLSGPMRVGVEVPYTGEGAKEIAGVFRWAQEVGADMCRVAAPWRGWEAPQTVVLDLLSLYRPPFNRTSPGALLALRRGGGEAPGVERRGGCCPVGALQWEVMPDMRLRSCPFQEGVATMDAEASEVRGQLAAHRGQIRACRRECFHPDLSL